MSKKDEIQTRLVHAGEHDGRIQGSMVWPIFQSTVFEVDGEEGYDELTYIRYNNLPNQRLLGTKLADLEGAEAATVAASGMAAIASALLAVLRAGDHLLAGDCLYGGTHTLITQRFPTLGIDHDLVDFDDAGRWQQAVRPETRAIYVETIGNPLMGVPPLDDIVAFARQRGLVTLIDNTFASPVLFRPAEHGFDLSLHSCTKYLNGHSDLVAGAVIGSRVWIDRVDATAHLLGGALDPHTCFLLNRGMKTLALRLGQQCTSALTLARWLETHPAVHGVRYPGLPSHPDHERAARLLDGFGGMLAFDLKGGREAADRMMSRTRLATHAPSLGGVETLIVSPARSSHAKLSPEARAAMGISDGLIRVSVGIEATADLIADFAQALEG